MHVGTSKQREKEEEEKTSSGLLLHAAACALNTTYSGAAIEAFRAGSIVQPDARHHKEVLDVLHKEKMLCMCAHACVCMMEGKGACQQTEDQNKACVTEVFIRKLSSCGFRSFH